MEVTLKSLLSRSTIIVSFVVFMALHVLISTAIAAIPQIVIHWSSDRKIGSEVVLRGMDGSAISAGKSYNGDGSLVTLGYFDDSNSTHPFHGNWIPLTSGTRIGDSSTGYGFEDGHFFVTSIFTKDSDTVEIYPTEPAFYETFAPHPITSSLPKPGTPICIRYYDSHEITINTRYNTVTGPDWVWPAFSAGIPENLYLKVSDNTPAFNSIWKYGYQFQYSDFPTFTSEPVDAELPHYSLNVNVVGSGTVSEHNATYKAGTVVELTATPSDSQTEFARWEGSGLLQYQFPTTYASMTDDLNVTVYFEPKKYTVSMQIQGTGDVLISGSDDSQYQFGDVLELNATTSFGHVFSHWLGIGPDSNESFTTLPVDRDHEITAVFIPQTLDLNVTASVSSHGTASVMESGPYTYASRYSISATSNPGFVFSHWSSPNGGIYMLDDANLSFTGLTLSDHADIRANFDELFYNLDISMGNGGQTVSPESGSYSAANLIEVTAEAAMGYEFHKWNDPSGILIDPYSAITDANLSLAQGDVILIATFKKKNFEITLVEETGGNVIFSTPNGPWEYLGRYELEAVAQPGYRFANWSGDTNSIASLRNGSLDANNSLNVTSDVNLTANFEIIEYSIEVTTTAGGQVSGGGNDFNVTSLPTISAYPGSGWQFSHWEGNETHLSQLSSTTSASTIVNLAGGPLALSFEAHFIKDALTLSVQSLGGGLVNDQSNFEMQFENGSEINLVAVPDNGWVFSRWFDTELADPYLSNLNFSPESDTIISALFTRRDFHLNLENSPYGMTEGGGYHAYGSNVQIKAIPVQGYEFSGWDGDIAFLESSTLAQTTVTIPDRNISLSPLFSPSSITISTFANGSGTVTGAGTYAYGNEASFQASPLTGHVFEEWTLTWADGNISKFSTNPLKITATEDFSVTADFVVTPEQQILYSLISSPDNGGILYDDPENRVWDPIDEIYDRKLFAHTNPGFSFIGWSTSPNLILSPNFASSTIEVRPSVGSTVTANFNPIQYKLLSVYDSEEGSVVGNDNNLSYFENAQLTATANTGFDFDCWKINKSITYDVQVGNSVIEPSNNKLLIDGQESPQLTLIRGFTYVFQVDVGDGNEFFISTSSYNNDTFADEFTSGILNSRITNGTLIFQVPMDAPNTLYYASSQIPFAGNTLKIITRSDAEILPSAKSSTINPTMLADLSFEAVFKNKEYDLSVTATEGGEVNFTSGSFPHASTVSLTATPNEHFRFLRWEGDDQVEGKTTNSTSIQLLSDQNIRAIFTPILYPLVVKTDPENAGIIETEGNLFEFPHGTEVNISVIPADRYVFAHWFGNVADPNNKNTSVVVNSATEITAHLSLAPVSINSIVSSLSPSENPLNNGQIGGSVVLPSIANVGKAFPVSAESNSGFSFQGWYDQGGKLLSSASTTYLTFYDNATIEARFRQKSYNVIIDAKDPATGNVRWEEENPATAISKSVAHGSIIQISAIPQSGYEFSRWTIRSTGLKTSSESTLQLEVTSDLEIEASYKEFIPELTIYVYPQGTGIIPTGNGAKSTSGDHIIMAQALSGYEFDHWIGQGIADSQNPTTTISFSKDQTVVARFKEKYIEFPDLPAVDEENADNGSLTDDWFGRVWSDSGSELQYHEVMGWMYIQEKTDDSLWFWIPSLNNWYWTEQSSFPSVYDDARQIWAEVDLILSKPNNIVINLPNELGVVENPLIPGSVLDSENERWWVSSWFDPYWHLKDSRWVYHRSLGWMYLHPSGLHSVWTWIEILGGWYWTSSDCYPYIYESGSGDWLWFDRINSSSNHRMFYRFGTPYGWIRHY